MTIAPISVRKRNRRGFWQWKSNDAIMQIPIVKVFSLIFLPLLVTEYSASGSGEGWESGSGSASGSWGESGDWEEHSGKRAWSDDEDL